MKYTQAGAKENMLNENILEKRNAPWIVLSFLMVLAFSVDSGAQPGLHPVSVRPGLFDTKLDRARTTGHMFPVKPEGVDQPQHVLSYTTGTGKALVILVDFPDHQANTNHSPSQYHEMLFSTATYPTGSMNDYYLENSYGTFGVTGDVTCWYRAPQPYAFYVNGNQGFGPYPNNAQKLVEHAVALADPDVDFSQYDSDNDGRVDGLFIVHAGPGAEETASAHDIWSHAWGPSSPISVDGVSVCSYSMEPEEHDEGGIISIGVFCHEFGHILGLPDLYDCDYSSDGIGNFGLMGTGSWGGDGRSPHRPVHFCAWSKIQLGWIHPIRITSDLFDQSIQSVAGTPEVYLLWTNGSGGNEYFLLSNRQKIGFDSKLPGSGLLIWHVDEAVYHNNDENHRKVDLEEADGLNQLGEYTDFNRGDGGDFFPGSTGNRTSDNTSNPSSRSNSGSPTGVAVRNISDSAPLMTADLIVTGTHYPDIHLSATSHDFGATVIHSTETWVFNIYNTGDATLTVNTINATHGDFEVNPLSLPRDVYPAGQLDVTVHFTPSSTGWINGLLTITSTDPNEGILTVPLEGYGDVSPGAPDMILLATEFDYGDVPVGYSEDWVFPVYNAGDADLLLSPIQSDGSDFTVISPVFPIVVSPQETLQVTVLFEPSRAGELTGQLLISSNDDQGVFTIDVVGTGLASQLIVSPTSIDQHISDSVPVSVELSIDNTGNHPLFFEIGEIASWLDVTPVSGAVGVNQTMKVTATIDGSLLGDGESNTEITLFTNDPVNSTFTIHVSVHFENTFIYVGSSISYGYPSDTSHVPIEMDNFTERPVAVGGFQTEMIYDYTVLFPVGVTPTERSQSMSSIIWSSPEPGRIILLVSDTQGNTILPGTGPIAHVHFIMTDSAQAGQSYWIEFIDVVLADERGLPLPVSKLSGLVIVGCKGDMNCDGCINIVDLVHVVNIILGNTNPTEAELWAADYNDDGVINVMDIIDMVGSICNPSPPSAKGVLTQAELSIHNAITLASGQTVIPIALYHRGDVAGAQFEIAFNRGQFVLDQIIPSERCQDMMVEWTARDGHMTVLMYFQDAGAIPAGGDPILYMVQERSLDHTSAGGFRIEDVVLGNQYGESIPVEVADKTGSPEIGIPDDYALMQNSPNPFNPMTDIRYQISDHGSPVHTTLRIYNVLGQEVRILVEGLQNPGTYTVQWDGRDQYGREVGSGIYFYSLRAGAWRMTKTMTLVR